MANRRIIIGQHFMRLEHCWAFSTLFWASHVYLVQLNEGH